MKLPAFQFYPGDWTKDAKLRSCTHAAKGAWVDLLCLMFDCDERGVLATNGRAWTDEEAARAIGCDVSLIQELTLKGVVKRNLAGALYSARMTADEHKRRLCSEAGKLGGNPHLSGTLKGLFKGDAKGDAKGHPKRKPTPSSSSSSSETKSAASPALPFSSESFVKAWALFKQHRSEIHKPLKPTSEQMALKQLSAMGESRAIRCIEHTVAKGWQGLREPDGSPVAQISTPRANLPEPDGWRAWVNENTPDAVYARGNADEGKQWGELDRVVQDYITKQLGRNA